MICASQQAATHPHEQNAASAPVFLFREVFGLFEVHILGTAVQPISQRKPTNGVFRFRLMQR